MQNRSSFIDIHTHQDTVESGSSTFHLRNVIIARDKMNTHPCSAGIHPWYIQEDGKAQLNMLREMLGTYTNILAIGECGLDKVTATPWQTQEAIFSAQLTLAGEFNKPIIIHCVRAYQEVIRLIKHVQNTKPVIMHGFNKSVGLARQLLDQHFYLSLGDSILRGHQDQLIADIPLDRLFFETDSSTTPISEIYMYFCRVRNLRLNELQAQIWSNFEEVFN
ncbi:TatD family hydrolase [Sphingobacterium sp. lm-10]|uniref:TatD family hydrolase n=1 Tax=Sphingobacterium sp. lm-10 TaxID=2944904 RepID=UPI0020209DA9|nr:TatD family hydrolase [Sphingobacterium sp. lm-10]MCL7986881.1 TatD family hydrolase [Sphingobacterium sp. lm-10]